MEKSFAGLHRKSGTIRRRLREDYQLYIFLIPAIVYFILFHYMPIYGVQIAFKDFVETLGFAGSKWVGLDHFVRFFHSYQLVKIIRNTLLISGLELLFSFPLPILLALLLNQTPNQRFKKVVQTVTYAPHFISTVVLVGMLQIFLSPRIGLVNHVIRFFGGTAITFMGDPDWFRTVYVGSGIWQNSGWSSVLYIAALASVDPGLYDAAKVDGCSRWQIIGKIDLPSILPTAIIMLIMNAGKVMSLGFQKAYLMQNVQNLVNSEIISTYVYKIGLIQTQYSYSAAIGLFNSVVNIILLITVNTIANKVSETSLW